MNSRLAFTFARLLRARCSMALAVLFVPATSSAHHPDASAGGGSGAVVTIGAGTLEAGQAAVAFIEQYIRFTGFDFRSLGANQEAHDMTALSSPAIAAAYGVTDDLTVSVRLPYVSRVSVVDGHKHANPLANPHIENLGDSAGIGDLTVLGQYRFLNNKASGTQAALLLGVKAPTGRTDQVTSQGDLFEAAFQPGSGSWDGLAGLALSQTLSPAWSVHASGLYILAGKGTQDTNLGDRFIYGAAVTYRLFGTAPTAAPHSHPPGTAPHSHAHAHAHDHGGPAHDDDHDHDQAKSNAFTLDGVLELNGEWQAHQTTAGVQDPNSGISSMCRRACAPQSARWGDSSRSGSR